MMDVMGNNVIHKNKELQICSPTLHRFDFNQSIKNVQFID